MTQSNEEPMVAMPVASKPLLAGRSRSLLTVVLATALWSTSGIFITIIIGGSSITAVGLAFWRDLLTFCTLLLGLALLRPGLLRVRRRDLPWLALMGAISIGLFHVAWNTSVLLNGVAITTVFQSNAPIIVTIVAWFLWREPLTGRKLGAIVLAVLGTILLSGVLGGGDQGDVVQITTGGLLLGFAVAGAYSTLSLFGKKLVGSYSPWTVLLYTFGFGALTLLPLQVNQPVPWPVSWPVLAAFTGLVLVTTVAGFGLYTLGLRGLQASVAVIVATTEIPFAAFLSYLVLGERLSLAQIVGSLLVVGGVILLSWPQRRRRARGAER